MNPILSLAEYAEPLLTSPYILRTRRNHGLEHATIHILSRGNYQVVRAQQRSRIHHLRQRAQRSSRKRRAGGAAANAIRRT